MKVINVTEKNMKGIYGKLKKFFYNKHRTGFEEWHNFDCGFKRHISPNIVIDKQWIFNVNRFPSPDEVEYIPKGKRPGIDYDYIRIGLTTDNGASILPGDKIAFLGNRIITRTRWRILRDRGYIYTVYQVLPMSKKEQLDLKEMAKMESRMYEYVE